MSTRRNPATSTRLFRTDVTSYRVSLIGAIAVLLCALAATSWPAHTSVEPSLPIRDSMLNAIDQYSSIEAQYVHRLLLTSDGKERKISVNLVRQPGVGAAATVTRADGVVERFVIDGRQMVVHDTSQDEYTVTRIVRPPAYQRVISVWERLRMLFSTGKGKELPVVLRQEQTELPLGWVSTAIFPQEWVLGTYDHSRVIDRGPEPLLGRDTEKLDVLAPNGRSYKVNVDRETGILLRVEIHENGTITDIVEAKGMKVNEAVDRANFAMPNLNGKKVREPGL